MRQTIFIIFIIFCTTTNICFSQKQINDPILKAIKEETERACANLKEKGHPPIKFLCTNITETITETYHASKGKQIEFLSEPGRAKMTATTMMIIGDSKNSSIIDSRSSALCVEKNETSIKIDLWHLYDQLYKISLSKYIGKINLPKSYIDNLSPEQAKLADFSHADTVIHIEPLHNAKEEGKRISKYIKKCSKVFLESDSLLSSEIRLTRNIINRWMYNNEGSVVRTSRAFYILNATMSIYSSNHLPINRNYYVTVSSLDELPSIEDFKNKCRDILTEMSAVRTMKKLDRIEFATIIADDDNVISSLYNGVIIGNANIRGSLSINLRSKEYSQGKKLEPHLNNLKNKRIMTEDLTITSLNIPSYNGVSFLTYNPIDAIGTRPNNSMVMVENGILRNLANTRVPTLDFPISNGHCMLSSYGVYVNPSVVKIDINKNKLYSSRKELYDATIRQIKEKGEKYIYILSNGVLRQVNIDSGEEFEISSYKTSINLRHNSSLFGATSETYVSLSGYISPKSIVLNDVEISPIEDRNISSQKAYGINTNDTRRPIVERPKKQ